MIMEIGNYVIEGARGEWTVTEKKTVKDKESKNAGEEYLSDARFYGRLYQALFSVLDSQLADADKVSVKELTRLINTHAKEIKEIADRKEV